MSYTDNAGAEGGMAWRGKGEKQGRGDNRHKEKGQRKMGKREGKRERRRKKKREEGREKEREKEKGEERQRGVMGEVQMGYKGWEMRYGRGERGEGIGEY